MRFGSDITKRFVKELEKIPSIRLACNKIGLHHSTYYRWIRQHPTFHKEVSAALHFSRDSMADAAESVIFSGIQKGSTSAAKYYLSNNEQRYMNPAKVEQRRRFEGELINQLKSKIPNVKEYPVFEHAFEEIYQFEKEYVGQFEPEFYDLIINKYAVLFAQFNDELAEVFKAAYIEWRDQKKYIESCNKDELDEDKSE